MDSLPIGNDCTKIAWETSKKAGPVASWPGQTTVLCHNCCHSFDTVPVPLPQAYDHSRRIYYCRGMFCSWNCAKSYNLTNTCLIGRGDRNAYIALLAYRLWVKRKAPHQSGQQLACLDRYSNYSISPSPPKECLRAFGGDMDIDEYRRGFLGILPPEEGVTGRPARNLRETIAKEAVVLPFVNLSKLSTPAMASARREDTAGVGNNTHRNPFMEPRTDARGVALHKNANDFCLRLNRATQNHSAMLKRKRDVGTKNTLMTSMGIIVQKKKK